MIQTGRTSPERAAEVVKAIKAREELRDLFAPDNADSWWQRLGESLFSSSSESPFGGDSSGFLDALPAIGGGAILVLALGVVALLFVRVSRSRKGRTKEVVNQPRLLVLDQLEIARAARTAGDLGASLRAFWAALVAGLGSSDELIYRPAWTCREMLGRSRSMGPDAKLLTTLLPRIERLEFGRMEITIQDVDELAALCEERLF